MVDIPDIELEFLFPAQAVPAIHLGPASEAGFDFVAAALEFAIARQVLRQQRPWTYEAHFAAENIPEFRKLIEAGGAEEAADTRETLGIRQRLAGGIERVTHGPELHQSERTLAQPGTSLAEEDGATDRDADSNRYGEQNWREHNQCQRGNDDVEEPLSPHARDPEGAAMVYKSW